MYLLKRIIDTFKKISVEPVAFAFILTIYCEYTALQDMIFLNECMNYQNVTEASNCSKESTTGVVKIAVSGLQATQMMYYMGIFSFLAVFASLFTGSWSDLFGRRPLMMLPSAFGILAEISFIIASIYMYDMDIKNWRLLIYLGSVFNGISGGTTTVVSTVFGYMTDITSVVNRSPRIMILEAFLFVGGFFGFNLAGILLKYYVKLNYQYIFGICLCFHLLIILYVYFLPETRGANMTAIRPISQTSQADLNDDQDSGDENYIRLGPSNTSNMFSLNHVKGMFRSIFKPREHAYHRKKILLLCVCAIFSSFATVIQVILTFSFVKKAPLNWDSSTYSLYSGLNYLLSGMALIIILPISYHFWKSLPDTLVTTIGFLSKGIGLLNFAVSTSTTQTFITIILLMFNEYTMPSMRSMISKLVDDDEKAKSFSFLGSLQNLIQFFGSLILPTIFTSSLNSFPGLSFVIVSIFQFMACLIIVFIHFKLPTHDPNESIDQDNQ